MKVSATSSRESVRDENPTVLGTVKNVLSVCLRSRKPKDCIQCYSYAQQTPPKNRSINLNESTLSII